MSTHFVLCLEGNHFKSGSHRKLPKFCTGIQSDISMTAQMCQRHLNMITQPQKHFGFRGVVPQDQTTVLFQNFVSTVEKVLRIRIVMEAVGRDDRIEGVLRLGNILAVSHDETGIRQVLGLGHADHFRGQIQSGVMFVGIFFM